MKLFLRILLFAIYILTVSPTLASETPSELRTESLKVETLEKTYVRLEVSDNNNAGVSIMRTVAYLTRILQSQKTYSLLNWRTYQRSNRSLNIPDYERVPQFGRWINDPDDDTCFNTRAKVLLRDSDKKIIFKDNSNCVVDSGEWKDPYTGRTFNAARDIQIDHFVPLKNAYKSGAHQWSFKARCLYANYLGYDFHLLSVDGPENMKKGDKGPDRYMPPNPEYVCTYLKNWLSIKFLWGLNMTESEAEAVNRAVKDNNCNLTRFRMSSQDVLRQSAFVKANMDLCEHVSPARVNAQ